MFPNPAVENIQVPKCSSRANATKKLGFNFLGRIFFREQQVNKGANARPFLNTAKAQLLWHIALYFAFISQLPTKLGDT